MIIIAIDIERFQLLWSFDSVDYRQLLSSEDVTFNVFAINKRSFRNFYIDYKSDFDFSLKHVSEWNKV